MCGVLAQLQLVSIDGIDSCIRVAEAKEVILVTSFISAQRKRRNTLKKKQGPCRKTFKREIASFRSPLLRFYSISCRGSFNDKRL